MNKVFEYLQTATGLTATAIGAPLIIIATFVIATYIPKRKKEPLAGLKLWLARDYFNYLVAFINASRDMDDLQSAMVLIDGFHDKPFRERISRAMYKKYYEDLLKVYCKKEEQLTQIPIHLCSN